MKSATLGQSGSSGERHQPAARSLWLYRTTAGAWGNQIVVEPFLPLPSQSRGCGWRRGQTIGGFLDTVTQPEYCISAGSFRPLTPGVRVARSRGGIHTRTAICRAATSSAWASEPGFRMAGIMRQTRSALLSDPVCRPRACPPVSSLYPRDHPSGSSARRFLGANSTSSPRLDRSAAAGRLMTIHIWPNVVGPGIVQASVLLAAAIVVEAALSFLGVGVQPRCQRGDLWSDPGMGTCR